MSWLKSLRRRQAESITGVFVANEQGWWLQQTDQPSAAADYLEQLRDGGLGALDAQGRPGLTWNTVYALLADRQHSDSIYLLGLPELSQARPVLRSAGTPSQPDFAVRISGWRLPARPDALMPREGALLLEPEGRRLLTPASWGLLGELRYLAANGASLDGDARMRQMGRIQQAAMSCSAELDGYLSSSPVVVADQLDLEIAAEGEMVMLTPRLLAGPQQGWIQAVDSYQSVRSRYDVVGNAGHLTHVVLDEAARGVVGAIKQFPGRRLFGDKARQFLDNPYPFLDDDAEKALSPERYEAARLRWEQTSGAAEPSADGVVHREPPGSATDTPMVDGAHDVDCPVNSPGQQWLPPLAPPSSGNHKGTLSLADLLDLSQYSDRVVEIEGKVVNVPRIPPDKVSQDWIEGVEDALHQSPDDRSSDKGWQQIIVTGLDAHELETFERLIRHGQENGDSHVTLPGTDHRIPLEAARQWLDDLKRLARRQIGNDAQKLSRPDAPRHATQVALGILHNIDELEYIEASRQDLDFAEEHYQAPAALRAGVQLKPHQCQGVARMQAMLALRGQGIAGMLLADDMGLGKTLQSLALMAWYRQTVPQPRPCLIVAPVSLLENWKAEIDKFLDGRQGATLTLYGSYLREHRVPDTQIPPAMREAGIKRLLREGFADNAAFVLTTYETLRDYQISLGRERWGVLICDEAQKIKTPAALVTRAAKAMQAEFRIACTGTPVENTLADLWCLFDFLQPGLLDSLSQFTRKFRQSIERREEDQQERVDALRARIRPWVLRRMKQDVADLLPKHEQVIGLPMSALQRQLYRQVVRQFQQALEDQEQGKELQGLSLDAAEQALDGSYDKVNGKAGGKGIAALTLLHHLRMICANPVAAAGQKPDLVPVEEHLRHSPKLAWLLDTLQDIAQQGARDPDHGNKVIVFTEFLPMQRLVQRAVAERFGFRPHIVNGSTSVVAGRDDSRQALIDAFQQAPGFGVIVLSTVAVGFGVNIQGANHVIHFTRPWNPAKEDQATDRAYRIGQTRAVHVYYPTIVGEGFESFEERVATRLAGKRALSADMLSPEQSLTADDFLGLEGG